MPEQIEHQDTQNKQSGDRPATSTVIDEEVPEQKSGRKFIVIAVIIFLLIGAGIFYWRSTFTEDTDDAQVDGDLYQVSSRITGQVIKVYVDDNQQVKIGDPIAEIDPKDYQVALEQAQANLASAQASAIQQTVNVPITNVNVTTSVDTTGSDVQASTAAVDQSRKQEQAAEARVAAAKANAVKSRLDVERYTRSSRRTSSPSSSMTPRLQPMPPTRPPSSRPKPTRSPARPKSPRPFRNSRSRAISRPSRSRPAPIRSAPSRPSERRHG